MKNYKVIQLIEAPEKLQVVHELKEDEEILESYEKAICLALVEFEDGDRIISPVVIRDNSLVELIGEDDFKRLRFDNDEIKRTIWV